MTSFLDDVLFSFPLVMADVDDSGNFSVPIPDLSSDPLVNQTGSKGAVIEFTGLARSANGYRNLGILTPQQSGDNRFAGKTDLRVQSNYSGELTLTGPSTHPQ
jgi:hypothetical protein